MGNARPSGDTREGPPTRAEFGKGGRVEEGFLEEATSKQKPQGRGGTGREENAVPGKGKSRCRGPEAREGGFTTVKTQKSPEDIILLISNFKSLFFLLGSRNGMNESTILNQSHLNAVILGQ